MRRLLALVAACMALSSCGGATESGGGDGDGARLVVEVASFDVAVGEPRRFIVGLGLQAPEGRLYVSGGSVEASFFYLGEGQAEGREPAGSASGTFLPIPGSGEAHADHPEAAPASSGRGVYAIEDFAFDRPGFWEVEVTAEVADHGTLRGTGAFEVLPEARVPMPGDPAPETDNLTLDSIEAGDAPAEAVDSRAANGQIPDQELHDSTIAEAVAEGRPALVVFATPVYCVSKFCGPITDMVEELEAEYGDRAEFIHVEIWRDYEGQVVNRGAADWILRDETLQEPWVFLIGADGRIVERWDNVATRQEIEPYLQDLPPQGA